MRATPHPPRRPARLGLVGLVTLMGCPAPLTEQAGWYDQLAPAGPCYDANLLDGLDETSTDELHDVFACLDAQGALAGFRPVDDAFDASTRDGLAGLVIAGAVNDLGDAELPEGVSLSGLVDDALALVEDPEPLVDTLQMGLELAWGVPWPALGGEVDPTDPAALDDSLLARALPVVRGVATVVLDQPESLQPLADALRAAVLPDVVWTIAAMQASGSPTLGAVFEGWPDDVAELIRRSEESSNDRWADASGNSLRDLLVLLVARQGSDGRVLLSALADDLLPILEDPVATTQLRAALQEQVAYDRFDALPAQLVYLVSVDARGGSLEAGEASALTSLLRLLATTNTEVTCEVPVLGLDISLGNLAVSLLGAMADLDPDTAVGGVELLSGLLGYSLTEDTLGLVADQCPALGDDFTEDVHALDRLVDPAVGDLLRVLLAALDALDADAGGETDHIPDIADAVTQAWGLGIVPPAEEAIRDVADTQLVRDVLGLLPSLFAPDDWYDLSFFPDGVRPLSWETLVAILPDLLGPGASGDAPLDTLRPLTQAILLDQGTWSVVTTVGELLADPRARVRDALPDLAALLADDPWLSWAPDVAATVEDPSELRPVLVLVEAPGVGDALLATSAGAPGPVPTVTGWVVGDTLDVVLSTLRALASLLPEPE